MASHDHSNKEIIPKQDLDKISAYVFGEPTPISLRFRIWLLIAIQFISRGLEFHEQLKTDSFEFHVDENKQEYVALSHETKQKIGKEELMQMKTQKRKECMRYLLLGQNVQSPL